MTDSSENSEGFEDLKKKVLEKLRKFYRYIRKKKKIEETLETKGIGNNGGQRIYVLLNSKMWPNFSLKNCETKLKGLLLGFENFVRKEKSRNERDQKK